MVIFFLKINPSPVKRPEVLELLHYLQGPTLVAPGCLDCSVYEGTEAVLYIEQWQGREEMYEHIRSSSYMTVLTAMELSVTVPQVNFVDLFESNGIELIEKLRSV